MIDQFLGDLGKFPKVLSLHLQEKGELFRMFEPINVEESFDFCFLRRPINYGECLRGGRYDEKAGEGHQEDYCQW